MFKNRNNNRIKIISLIVLIAIILNVFTIFLNVNSVKATSNRYVYDGNNLNTDLYPGYKEKMDAMLAAHPNWTIVVMETGLDWNQVIVAEKAFAGSSPYSLIQGKSGAWICSECGSRRFDNGSWCHASEAAIKYLMDPRAWMDPSNPAILQFLQIGGQVDASDESIYNAIRNTFLDRDGLGMENARAINNASKSNGANPFYVVARIIQEQGVNGSATYRMESDGAYYYNIFNIGASGNGTSQIIANALEKAKSKGWDTLEKSISGGIQFLFSEYINQKQDTIYLNKFDVESYGGLYAHQYMQNVEAPKSEATLMYNKIKDSGVLDQSLTFVIPVFQNMPSRVSDSPDSLSELGPRNIRIKEGHSDVALRDSRSTTDGNRIMLIRDSSTNILSVERYGDGWHKVILEDGTEGYVYFDSSYLEEVNDVTNCNEGVVVTTNGVELKAGPKANQQTITNLVQGQPITRIDNSGRYNFDGKIWDRVIVGDGQQGFISREYLELESDSSNVFTVRAEGGLYLRSEPGGNVVRLLADGSKVTRTDIGTSLINGYYWDRVTTASGATGYVARAYLRDRNGNVPSGVIVQKAEEVKKDDEKKQIKAEPDVSAEILKKEYGEEVSITKPDGTAVTEGAVGTGYKVQVGNETYTIVKIGDCNGDGKVSTVDAARALKNAANKYQLEGVYLEALDTNGDGNVTTVDAARILKEAAGKSKLSI